jgi:acyl-CoA reductase-like NAD-dependent aldehyde dehydrogenase
MSLHEALTGLSDNVRTRFFIGGEWVRSQSHQTQTLVSSSTRRRGSKRLWRACSNSELAPRGDRRHAFRHIQWPGARLLAGGARDPAFTTGYFVRPTLFADVTPQMSIARDEIFGPVICAMPYEGIDEAISIANSSEYGLSGTVFSSDPERAYEVANRIKSGHIGVNGFDMAPAVPFGGYKSSGMGREGGPEGLEAFLETQAIYLPCAP